MRVVRRQQAKERSVTQTRRGCARCRWITINWVAPSWRQAKLAHQVGGLLPCGLLYGMLALAASTHDLPRGALVKAVFGLERPRAMLITGLGSQLASLKLRKRLYMLGSWSLLLAGLFTSPAAPTPCPVLAPHSTPIPALQRAHSATKRGSSRKRHSIAATPVIPVAT
jgi:hypothetical protein